MITDPVKRKASQARYYSRKKEAILAQQREYYHDNKDHIRAAQKAYHESHSLEHHKRSRLWRLAHPQKANESSRKWRESNPLAQRIAKARRRARERKAFVEDVDPMTVYSRDEGFCGICGGTVYGDFHVDHIIPLSKGGLHCYANVQLAHPACNLSKGNNVS